MGDRARGFHQLGCFGEEGIGPGGGHQGHHFALLGHRTGISHVPRLFIHRQRLPGEGGLVHAQIFALYQLDVSWNNLPQVHADNISRH